MNTGFPGIKPPPHLTTDTAVPLVRQVDAVYRAENILGLPVSARPWSCVLTITPEHAAALLQTRPSDPRRVRKLKVYGYGYDMEHQRWRLTHQGIAFDEHGNLLDGQHRLLACVATGCDFTTMASFAMPRSAYPVLDRGAQRNIADDITIRGLATGKLANVLQSAARIITAIDAGKPPMTAELRGPKSLFNVDDVENCLNIHPLLAETARLVLSHRQVAPVPPEATTSGFMCLFREVDERLAALYLHQLMTGENLGEGDPAGIIRSSLATDSTRLAKVPRFAFMYRLVRGWNNLREGRRVSKLYSVEHRDAGFPKIDGYHPPQPKVLSPEPKP